MRSFELDLASNLIKCTCQSYFAQFIFRDYTASGFVDSPLLMPVRWIRKIHTPEAHKSIERFYMRTGIRIDIYPTAE